MAVRRGSVFWGVWGGFPPIIGHTWPPCVERGGLGGILPPILGRKDFGAAGGGVGGGPGVKEAGRGAGQGISSGVVCSL